CEALDLFEKIIRDWNDNRFDELIRSAVSETYSRFSGATGETELPKQGPCVHGWDHWLKTFLPFWFKTDTTDPARRMSELLNSSEELRQIEAEWERFWMIDHPSHLTYDRIHGGIQDEVPEAEKNPVAIEIYGTPLPRILADLFRGQGMNLYLDKPPVRE